MERCTNCGKKIGTPEQVASFGEFCDGILTMDVNPVRGRNLRRLHRI